MALKYTVTIEIEVRGELDKLDLISALGKGIDNELSNMQDWKLVATSEPVKVADVVDSDE
jgi:hypothetical protein